MTQLADVAATPPPVATTGAQSRPRHYEVSPHPLIDASRRPTLEAEATLLGLYTQMSRNWCELLVLRSKMLVALPTATLFLVYALLAGSGGTGAPSRAVRTALAIVGVAAFVGMMLFDQRTAELHDDLNSRARRAEHELGIDTGAYRGTPSQHRFVQHDRAAALVCAAILVAWGVATAVLWVGR